MATGQTTMVQYQFTNNLNPDTGALGSPNLSYHKLGGSVGTPEYDSNMLKVTSNNEDDYLELSIDTTGKQMLALSFYADFIANISSSAGWIVSMNTGVGGSFETIGSLILNSSGELYPENYAVALPLAAENKSDLIIRIQSTFSVRSDLKLRMDNLKLVYGAPNIRVYTDSNNTYIPHLSEASIFFDTDFGTVVTNPNTNDGIFRSFRIRNYHGDTGSILKVDSIRVRGASLNDYTVTPSDDLPGISQTESEVSAEYETIEIKFKPKADGLRPAEIYIYSNAAPNPYIIKVIGTGSSCKLTAVLFAENKMESGQQSLTADYNPVTDLISGTSETNSLGIQLYQANQSLYMESNNVDPGAQSSWFVCGEEKTVKFGGINITDQKDINITFHIAAFTKINDKGSMGVCSDDYVILSVKDKNGDWSQEVKILGSEDSSTHYRYQFGSGSAINTDFKGNNTPEVWNNNTNVKIKKVILKIPVSANIQNLEFKITAKTSSSDWMWLIDEVQVNSRNSTTRYYRADGTWDPKEPESYERAVIEGQYVVLSDEDEGSEDEPIEKFCECEIKSGGSVTVPSGKIFRIRGRMVNENASGGFVVEDGGTFMQIEDEAVNIGPIIVKRSFNFSNGRQQYNFVMSPAVGQNIKEIYTPNAPVAQIYNEATSYFDNNNGNYKAGRGFAIQEAPGSGATQQMAEFKGVPFNGIVNFKVRNNGNGFNLTGNPYPSYLNLNKLYKANLDVIEPSFYFWDNRANEIFAQQGSSYGNDSYAVFNASTTGGGTGVPATTTANDNGITDKRKPNRFVDVGQAFIVQAKDGLPIGTYDLKFNNSIRAGKTAINNSNIFFGKNAGAESSSGDTGKPGGEDRYWLNLQTPDGLMVMNAVAYFEGGKDEYSVDDTESLGTAHEIYTRADGYNLIIQGRKEFSPEDQLELGYKANNAGYFIIGIDKKQGTFKNTYDILLVDNVLNRTWNLSKEPYRFLSKSGRFNNRFLIIYQERQNLIENQIAMVESNTINFLKRDGEIEISSSLDKIEKIEIYDLNSKLIYSATDLNSNHKKVSISKIKNQIFVVSVLTQTGERVNKKFIN